MTETMLPWDLLKRKVSDLLVQLEAHTYIEEEKIQRYLMEIHEKFQVWKKWERDQCPHEWKDIRNKVVESGEMCFKCGSLRAGNEGEEKV